MDGACAGGDYVAVMWWRQGALPDVCASTSVVIREFHVDMLALVDQLGREMRICYRAPSGILVLITGCLHFF